MHPTLVSQLPLEPSAVSTTERRGQKLYFIPSASSVMELKHNTAVLQVSIKKSAYLSTIGVQAGRQTHSDQSLQIACMSFASHSQKTCSLYLLAVAHQNKANTQILSHHASW